MRQIVDGGRAPTVSELTGRFDVTRTEMIQALEALQDDHGVVLHPDSAEIWVMHPFSTAPTNFWIEAADGGWWGNCAWCSLGAAALLDRDLTITTTLGGEAKQVVIEVSDGRLVNENLFIHFPVPMSNAWDNVTFTCSVMLMFESELHIDDWCHRHGMSKGDVQPIGKIWEFAKVWYGRHLDRDWVKWSVAEARQIFERFELVDPIWQMPSEHGRF